MPINLLDTMFVLFSAYLVFIMHLGFATVEAGFTRAKNTASIIMKNMFTVALGTMIFFIFGFTLAFSGNGAWIGNLDHLFIEGVGLAPWAGLTIPGLAFFFFQAMFAATAATIVSGAVAERIKFNAYALYSILLIGVIYATVAHWVWGGGWLSNLDTPFVDFAGSTVVHSVGAWSALAGVIVLGPRIGKFQKDGTPNAIPGHNIALAAIGGLLLWFGWFGFNPGSELAADLQIAHIAVTTNLAGAAGAITAMLISWVRLRKPDVGMTINGFLAGLVGVTAATAVVTPFWASIIGVISGLIVVYAVDFFESTLKLDDPVGALSVHGACGVFGTLSVGLFSAENGLITTGSISQLISQIIGIGSVFLFVFPAAFAAFKILDRVIGIRVPAEDELKGLDITEFGLSAYPDFILANVEGE
ncbi:MAG TPA: ammonium transporter [Euryarchaeota archaeon]|nr:ammonium transporter [Euryarchaeota archaeon]